jgi:hypothetical protein
MVSPRALSTLAHAFAYAGGYLVGEPAELRLRVDSSVRLNGRYLRTADGRNRLLFTKREFSRFADGRLPSRRNAFEIIGHIEIGFIERKRLDQRGVVLEDRMDLS